MVFIPDPPKMTASNLVRYLIGPADERTGPGTMADSLRNDGPLWMQVALIYLRDSDAMRLAVAELEAGIQEDAA